MLKAGAILLGGALGSLARYGLAVFAQGFYPGRFPFGTFVVNTLGCFLIGIVWALAEKTSMPHYIQAFIMVGFLGAFTTFSTFCAENFDLVKSGEIRTAFVYIIGSNLLGILLVFGGFYIAKNFLVR